MAPDSIIATGTTIDSPEGLNMSNSGKKLRWVAVRGGIYDWAIYAHFAIHSETYVRQQGDKVYGEHHIKRLVFCDDEAFALYRY